MQIRIGRMWSGLARLSENRWFVGVRETTRTFFVDIGCAHLAVFWVNGAQIEDSNKTVGVLGWCIR